jgi:hypothetical protein
VARYSSARVVLGHWSVTPHGAELDDRVDRFCRGEMTPTESKEFLEQQGVTWIFWGIGERHQGSEMKAIPGFDKRVINRDVVLYRSRRGGHTESGSRNMTLGTPPASDN